MPASSSKMISTDCTPANQAHILQLLGSAPGRLAEICQGISEAQARRAPESGERALVEIVAHLLNSEARAAEVLFQALLLNEPLIPPIHPERQWGPLARYDRLPLADQVAYFRLRRAVLLPVLTGLTARPVEPPHPGARQAA